MVAEKNYVSYAEFERWRLHRVRVHRSKRVPWSDGSTLEGLVAVGK